MKAAIYVRVSTLRQQRAQTIEQQLDRLRVHVAAQGWSLADEHIFRDDGYSGARLSRPGLDSLRDRAAMAEFEVVVITAPDRLARKYVHQVLLLEELESHGCRVEFLDRPMSDDPHDQLVLQIRGAVAEYERALIADRMRRGRLAKLRAGQLLPWTKALYGYVLDAERPRDPTRVRINPVEAAVVRQIFAWYIDLEEKPSLYAIAKRLSDQGIPTPSGGQRWNVASIRGMLKNPAYTGTAYANRTRPVPARQRKSALLPVGPGFSQRPRPEREWIPIAVPAIVTQEQFDQVQARLSLNQQMSRRNNTKHQYLLRGLVSCGQCRLSCTGRSSRQGYNYYICRGKTDALRASQEHRCLSRFTPAEALDELVWTDLCYILTHPESITVALERAQSGQWLPQQLQARSRTLKQALAQLTRQQDRLLKAYLAEVIDLAEFERKRRETGNKQQALQTQLRQLEAQAEKRIEMSAVATSIETFCQRMQQGLEQATFDQRRQLVELLIDRVIVDDDQVEIRYVIPTSEAAETTQFCHLRTDYLNLPALEVQADNVLHGKHGRVKFVAQKGIPFSLEQHLDHTYALLCLARTHPADQVLDLRRILENVCDSKGHLFLETGDKGEMDRLSKCRKVGKAQINQQQRTLGHGFQDLRPEPLVVHLGIVVKPELQGQPTAYIEQHHHFACQRVSFLTAQQSYFAQQRIQRRTIGGQYRCVAFVGPSQHRRQWPMPHAPARPGNRQDMEQGIQEQNRWKRAQSFRDCLLSDVQLGYPQQSLCTQQFRYFGTTAPQLPPKYAEHYRHHHRKGQGSVAQSQRLAQSVLSFDRRLQQYRQTSLDFFVRRAYHWAFTAVSLDRPRMAHPPGFPFPFPRLFCHCSTCPPSLDLFRLSISASAH